MISRRQSVVICFILLLKFGLNLEHPSGNCNCGPDWEGLSGCSISFEGCSPPAFSNAISGPPEDVTAKYFIENRKPGLIVSFKESKVNPTLAQHYNVRIFAKDYPVGFNECFIVTVRQHSNRTISLKCLNTDELTPRHKFGIEIQPSPTDIGMFSNKKSIDYTMPPCSTIEGLVQVCENYNNPTLWVASFRPIINVVGNGERVQVFFETYEYTVRDRITTYKITVYDSIRHTYPEEYLQYVDCTDVLEIGESTCNTTYDNIKPGSYYIYQQIFQVDRSIIGASRKQSLPFQVIDLGDPKIIDMPMDIIKHINTSVGMVNVTWQPPTATDNFGASQVTLTSSHGSGDLFPVGKTTVTYIAVDGSGRKTTTAFEIIVIGSAAAPSGVPVGKKVIPPSTLLEKHKLLIGGLCGAAVAVLLLSTLLFLKWKAVMKRNTSCSDNSEDRMRRRPEENSDSSYYKQDTDNLVPKNGYIDASHANVCSLHDDYNDSGLKAVMDNVSLSGHTFGPSPQTTCNHQPPNVTVLINTRPAPTQQSNLTTWVSACVENEPQPQFMKKEQCAGNYSRLDSCDSGIGGNEPFQYPWSDLTSVSQISNTNVVEL